MMAIYFKKAKMTINVKSKNSNYDNKFQKQKYSFWQHIPKLKNGNYGINFQKKGIIAMMAINSKPEALKSLYRSPGYKKKQLVLCKNYVVQW